MPVVKLLGGMGRRFGKRLASEAATVAHLLRDVAEQGGPELVERLFHEGGLHRDLRVLVNGRNIVFLDGVETRVGPEDVVTLHETGVRGYPGG